MGTLGLMTEVSLKVLPFAPAEATLVFPLGQAAALEQLHRWAGEPLPLNASCWVHDGSAGAAGQDLLFVRLRGAVAAVEAACQRMLRGGTGRAHGPGASRRRLGPLPRPDTALLYRRCGHRSRLVALVGGANRSGAGLALGAVDRVAWRCALALGAVASRAQLQTVARAAGGNAMVFVAGAQTLPGPSANSALKFRGRPLCSNASRQRSIRPVSSTLAGSTQTSDAGRHSPHLMQTQLAPEYQNTADGQAAEAILRKCVHCGFAPRRARPTSCSAMSSMARAAVST